MHRRSVTTAAVGALVFGLFVGSVANPVSGKARQKSEPDAVVVQHCLIGFKGKVEGKDVTRTKKEAKALAEELLERATAGEDFDEIVEGTGQHHLFEIVPGEPLGDLGRADQFRSDPVSDT